MEGEIKDKKGKYISISFFLQQLQLTRTRIHPSEKKRKGQVTIDIGDLAWGIFFFFFFSDKQPTPIDTTKS